MTAAINATGPAIAAVSDTQIDQAMQNANEVREANVGDVAGAQPGGTVAPEDGSLQTNMVYMAKMGDFVEEELEQDEGMVALSFVQSDMAELNPNREEAVEPPGGQGGGVDEMSLADSSFLADMAEIGQKEGFGVLVGYESAKLVMDAELAGRDLSNVTVLKQQGFSVWTEDIGEMTVDGSVTYPSLIEEGGTFAPFPGAKPREIYDPMTLWMLFDRVTRFHPEITQADLIQIWNVDLEPKMVELRKPFEDEARTALAKGEVTPEEFQEWMADIARNAPSEAIQTIFKERWPDVSFSWQGRVNGNREQRVMAHAGLATGNALRENFSYTEGGNQLMGTDKNGKPYVMVGRDTFAITRGQLERDLGRPVSDDEVKIALAKDYGVAPDKVVPVEQPGEFHLDMCISPVKGGKVLLNDAMTAFGIQEKWLRADHLASRPANPGDVAAMTKWHQAGAELEKQLTALKEEYRRLASYEDEVIRDLEAAGLEVLRLAGVYLQPEEPTTQLMNFLNAEKGTGQDDKQFQVTLGGDPRAEAYVEEMLTQVLPTGIERVHFLDPKYTLTTLRQAGGINCRVKSDGTIVTA